LTAEITQCRAEIKELRLKNHEVSGLLGQCQLDKLRLESEVNDLLEDAGKGLRYDLRPKTSGTGA
jgi:hypothetical protein